MCHVRNALDRAVRVHRQSAGSILTGRRCSQSLARCMQAWQGLMGNDSRRCALWVSPPVLAAAEELAELIGLDVDTFVAMIVLELHEQELAQGRLRARRAAGTQSSSNGHVIPMSPERGRQPRRSQARME